MPTYEYVCDACQHAFEKFHAMSAEPIKICPKCGKKKVRRLISTGAGMIFKGSGFYITDYRDAAYKDKAKADSGGSSPSGEGKADSKPDGKPDAKPDAKPDSKPAETAAPKAEPTTTKPAPAKSSETASKSAAKASSSQARSKK